MDHLSRECIIIGSVTLILSSLMFTLHSMQLIKQLQSDYSDDLRWDSISYIGIFLLGFAAVALFSILFIVGIKKRRLSFMCPWLLIAFVGVGFSAFFIVANLIILPFAHLEFMLMCISIIGLECIVLYPVIALLSVIYDEQKKSACIEPTSKC